MGNLKNKIDDLKQDSMCSKKYDYSNCLKKLFHKKNMDIPKTEILHQKSSHHHHKEMSSNQFSSNSQTKRGRNGLYYFREEKSTTKKELSSTQLSRQSSSEYLNLGQTRIKLTIPGSKLYDLKEISRIGKWQNGMVLRSSSMDGIKILMKESSGRTRHLPQRIFTFHPIIGSIDTSEWETKRRN